VRGCDAPGKVVDHIIGRRRGGSDTLDNLRHLCRDHDNQLKEDASGQRRSGGTPIVRGCNATGQPLDPNHPWNRT
jgi:5-methylcytosine-specific restriction endonuclease McrA